MPLCTDVTEKGKQLPWGEKTKISTLHFVYITLCISTTLIILYSDLLQYMQFNRNFFWKFKVVPQPVENINLNELQSLISGEGNLMEKLLESNAVLAIGLASNIATTLNSLGRNDTSNDSSSIDASKQVSAEMPLTKDCLRK